MSPGLTPKQLELLRLVTRFIQEHGYSPSFEEMRSGVGLASKSGVVRLLGGLEERGAIRRLHGRVRAIEVLRAPPPPPASRAPDGAPLYFVPVAA